MSICAMAWTMKIGVSFTSIKKAKMWLEKEIPDWDYEGVRAETCTLWNHERQKIQRSGEHVTDVDRMKHYTAICHAMCMPATAAETFPAITRTFPYRACQRLTAVGTDDIFFSSKQRRICNDLFC